MSLHRRAAKRDANEPAIIEALERCGWQVIRLSQRGLPDLLISRAWMIRLAEVKGINGEETQDQRDFNAWWTGPPVVTLRTVEDVVTFTTFVTVGRLL